MLFFYYFNITLNLNVFFFIEIKLINVFFVECSIMTFKQLFYTNTLDVRLISLA